MTDFTVGTADAFADGTTIGAYPASAWAGAGAIPSGSPLGTATDEQDVADSEVTFTGLTAGTTYYAAEDDSGTRYIRFTVPTTDLDTSSIQSLATDVQTELDADDSAISALQSGLLVEAGARVTGDIPDLGAYFVTPGLANFSGVAVTADRVYYSRIIIPTNATLTGVVCSNSSGAAGNVRSALYDDTGARVANRSTDFTVTSGANHVAFDSPYAAVTGIYFAAVVFSATPTMHFQLPAAPSGYTAGPGSGATAPSITAPTSIDSQRVATVGVYG